MPIVDEDGRYNGEISQDYIADYSAQAARASGTKYSRKQLTLPPDGLPRYPAILYGNIISHIVLLRLTPFPQNRLS